eukprot:CAMPEP_0118716532 /NCGR_PEP_ID=MMETSP0800-20121206/27549_1 /TAXON_ID=210618 ORGANISM="Striatella unipunctata, Strain CCMP2910" /NCGR_SAMPLE_ID=MMETSP0800 /ASSEMBLY_ACC=CAM_ASM_000638 /LENGTH=172 /DNA_ID=CAMNT_0006622955 /DNA_START=45 /DNA_END=563 /DNA_ORIENTATION=+
MNCTNDRYCNINQDVDELFTMWQTPHNNSEWMLEEETCLDMQDPMLSFNDDPISFKMDPPQQCKSPCTPFEQFTMGSNDMDMMDCDNFDEIFTFEEEQGFENVQNFQVAPSPPQATAASDYALIEATKKLVDSMKRSQMTRECLNGTFNLHMNPSTEATRFNLQQIMTAQSA